MYNSTLNLGQQGANFTPIFGQNKSWHKVKAWKSETQLAQGTIEISKTIHTKLVVSDNSSLLFSFKYFYPFPMLLFIHIYISMYIWMDSLTSNYP